MWHLHFKVIFILYSRERKKNLQKRSIGTSLSQTWESEPVFMCVFVCVCKRTEMSWFIETVNEKLVKFSSTQKLSSHFFPSLSFYCNAPVSACTVLSEQTTEQHKPAVHHNAVSLSYKPLLIFAFHYHPLPPSPFAFVLYVTVPF